MQPAPLPPVETEQLAHEVRRIVDRLASADLSHQDLTEAVEVARGFADRLDALPRTDVPRHVREGGLLPGDAMPFSPMIGPSNPVAPPMVLRALGPDGEVEGRVRFGAAYEGPPRHVHGGYLAAAFDEVLGWAQLGPGFTGTLTVRYVAPTPVGVELVLRARRTSTQGRKRYVEGTCHAGDTLCATAEAVFVEPRGGDFETALGL